MTTPVDIDKLKELYQRATEPAPQLLATGERHREWSSRIVAARYELLDLTPALIAKAERVDALERMARPTKLTMPNGEVIEVEYPDSPLWARSWSIRYPDTGRVGTTGEQDWELVERYGLTAILDAILSARNALSPKESE